MKAIVTGAGGFIGGHLVEDLLQHGDQVVAVDVKPRRLWEQWHPAADNAVLDLRDERQAGTAINQGADIVFALAADMGGMGYLTYHEADVMTWNTQISVNTIIETVRYGIPRLVYASSACVYPEYRQTETEVVPLAEDMAIPADPDLAYGWEKLATERLLAAYHAEGRLDVKVARLHNIYGPMGTWQGGREKAPAALCRKAALAPDGGVIDVWGDGKATRSFCYITDCVEGVMRLAVSDYAGPVNIGSDRLVTVDDLANFAIAASGKDLSIRHVAGPQGVRGRNSDNALCRKVLGWEPRVSLEDGMQLTYDWIAQQVAG